MRNLNVRNDPMWCSFVRKETMSSAILWDDLGYSSEGVGVKLLKVDTLVVFSSVEVCGKQGYDIFLCILVIGVGKYQCLMYIGNAHIFYMILMLLQPQ
jgi:hypothetical protein